MINPFDDYVEPIEEKLNETFKRVEALTDDQLIEFTEWLLDHYVNK